MGGHTSLSLKNNNKSLTAPLVGVSVFLATFLLSFISGSLVLSPSTTSAETAQTEIQATVNSVIAITTDATGGSLTIPITPTPTGTQSTGTVNINVSTNNLTGYTLNMNSSTNTTALTHTLAPANTIASTTATYASPQALTNNTWGYSTATTPTTFSLIPPLSTPQTIKTTTTPATTSNTPVTFAAKVTSDKASGTYSNTMVFTVTANDPPEQPPITDLGPMQALTLATCPEERSTAYDARNYQVVFVRKIPNTTADGTGPLCWMETNLRYAGDGYDSGDGSGPKYDYRLVGGYSPTLGWSDDRYATNTTQAANTASIYDDAKPLTMTSTGYFGGSRDNAYTVAGVADGGGQTTLNTTSRENTTAYTNNSTYYGYLYNWCAAMGGQTGDGTANTNSNNACANGPTSASTFDTTTSICPAGWRLPTGSSSVSTNEFGRLNTAVNSGLTNTDAGLRNNFLAVYSGLYSSGLLSQGSRGYYWSSTVSNATGSYGLSFDSTYVYPGTGSGGKYSGFSVRCVL